MSFEVSLEEFMPEEAKNQLNNKNNPDYFQIRLEENIISKALDANPNKPRPPQKPKTELELKIEQMEKELDELKKQKNRQFVRVDIQRNQELLKNLFETVIQNDGFLLGGFARVCVSKNSEVIPSGDIDVYVKGKEQFDLISKRLESVGYFETRKSETARTMQKSFSGNLPVQLIMPLNDGHVLLTSENIEDILNNFDFTIARVGITKESLEQNQAIADIDFEEDDRKKQLQIKNIHCPIAQVYRIAKYMGKGFWLPMRQCLKVVRDWETRPEEYKNKILEFVSKEEPTEEEIQQLEKLLHID